MIRIAQLLSFCAALCLATTFSDEFEARAERLDLPGKSYGGKVRSGPGLNYRQVGSTRLNDRVILIERSVRLDDYNWFLIRLPNGRTGYQYGGLMCADGEETGILTICGSQMDIRLSGQAPSAQPPVQNSRLDLPGKSYGGKVRAGPGLNYRQVGSTRLNDRIVLLERSVRMDDFDWFLIRMPNGATGYQWGGLMCADGEETGILTICGSQQDQQLSGYNSGGNTTVSQAPQNDEYYNCNEGIPLTIRFRNEGTEFVAYVSHDSFPEIRLPQIPGGSGNQFQSGPNWMGTKGNQAIINFNGIEDTCFRTN